MLGITCEQALDAVSDGVYIVDRSRTIIFWNKGAERITGYPASEVVGKSCLDNILVHVDSSGVNLCLGRCPLAATLNDGSCHKAEVFLHHRDGHRVPVAVKAGPLRDANGEIIGALELFSDNSAKLSALERLDQLVEESLLDPLTGVGSRRYAEITLRSRFDEQARYGWSSALLLCDIDDFKSINDTFGHDAGDKALRLVGQTIAKALRSFDFVGRWGGDEFLLCLPNIKNRNELDSLAERICRLVEGTWLNLDGQELRVTISIGATLIHGGDTMETAFKRADELLYASKQKGRNCVSSD